MTREEAKEALGKVWDWYQPDDQPDRPLEDILKDVAQDCISGRSFRIRVNQVYQETGLWLNQNVREADKRNHEVIGLRQLLRGVEAALK